MATKQTGNPRPDRQYRLLPASPVAVNWDDVPDALIVELVREYTRNGDAILFGTSKSQEVGAIRVYRGREPYSVYFRKAGDVGEAVERLRRMRPVRKGAAQRLPSLPPEAQGIAIPSLPFHPKFTVSDLIKQRRDEEMRAIAWRAMVSAIHSQFFEVAKG